MRNQLPVWTIVASLAWAGAASAQSTGDDGHRLVDHEYLKLAFDMADQNGDGSVCEPEIVADTASHFAALDDNRDDRLSAEEASELHGDTFRNLDVDGDGQLVFMELIEPRLAISEERDPNGDGCWSYEELATQTAEVCSELAAGNKVEIGAFVSEGEDVRCRN